jgi:hypothetical protein
VGWAAEDFCGARLCALAIVNPVGEVVAEDGSILAGATRSDGTRVRTADLLRAGAQPRPPARRPCSSRSSPTRGSTDGGLARGPGRERRRRPRVHPVATPFDGDVALCPEHRDRSVDPLALTAVAQDVVAAAVRDGARSARP